MIFYLEEQVIATYMAL